MKKFFYIASDHAAFQEKAQLVTFLKAQGHEVEDLGTHSEQSCHYPEYAKKLAEKMHSHKTAKGVLLCGSGIGVSIVANRFDWIRAARCCSVDDARLASAHNDANVICFGSRVSKVAEMQEMLNAWMSTPFEGGRHLERVRMFSDKDSI